MNLLNDIGLLIFRVSIGAFMLFGHGLGKLNKLLSGDEIRFLDPIGLGSELSFILVVLAEFLAAGLVILGLFTRISSLSLIITMFVAGIIYHADDPFGEKEKSLMFLVSFLLLFLTGPGKFSLNKLIENKLDKLKGFGKFILG